MSKTLYMLFAVAAYFIFFVTFLYLIAFVGDIFVPRTIDEGGAQASVAVALAVDVALIALFGVQHSVMARQEFKAAWTKIVPKPIERAMYVLAASATLCILFYFWRPVAGDVWRAEGTLSVSLIWTLFGLGWVIVLASTFLINHFELFGLQQVWRHMRGHDQAPFKFRTPLFYKFVRHPLYSGFLLAFWATPHMTWGHMLFSIGMTIYILIAISYEEKDLVGYFGQDYEQYQRAVGTLVPGIGKRS
jgi:methanethiol S-methyltransferase